MLEPMFYRIINLFSKNFHFLKYYTQFPPLVIAVFVFSK